MSYNRRTKDKTLSMHAGTQRGDRVRIVVNFLLTSNVIARRLVGQVLGYIDCYGEQTCIRVANGTSMAPEKIEYPGAELKLGVSTHYINHRKLSLNTRDVILGQPVFGNAQHMIDWRMHEMFVKGIMFALNVKNHELSSAPRVCEGSFMFSRRMAVLISQQRNLRSCPTWLC